MRSLALVVVLSLAATLPAGEPAVKVKTVKGIAYVDGPDVNKERQVLDLYLPEGVKDFPVLFFIHGGGWTGGSKNGFVKHGEMFAGKGIGFVAINYRLTPLVKHPGHIEDVASAFAWVHKNIGKHGGRADRILVSGHSAGGHLGALLATDESHLARHKLSLKDIRGVIPVSGVFQLSERQAKAFGDADSRAKASPQTHANGKRPPMLILYAEKEAQFFGDQARELSEALNKAGNEARVEMIAGRNHGSIMQNIANADDPATKLILGFIGRHSGK